MSAEKKEEPNRILVYLRIRPAKKGDPAKGIPPEINPADGSNYLMDVQPDNKTIILSEGGKTYAYDWVYAGDNVSQEDIYQKVTAPVIDNVFKGFWGTTMVYGQTGTGKSFTMCNFDRRCEGIIPRAMRQIFETIQADPDRKYTIKFSFIQIYCDRLQDLFNPNCKDELKLNRDKTGVNFPGIVEQDVVSEEDFRQKYEDGNQYRVVTATKMNPESSRGHAALFIQIKSEPKDDPSGEKRNGKLFLIDLAGYERFSKTGVQEGKMKEEAKTINASLLALGNVVQSLSEGSEHVPWRNAKLTRMLEDAIGGKAKCSIILTAGPSSEHIHETMGTLYFGARAMAVKTNATVSVNIDYQKLAKKLQEMLAAAEGRINTLEVEATKRQLEREQTEDRMKREYALMKQRQDEQLKKLLTSGATPEQIQELIDANQMETDILEEQQREERKVMEERHEESIQEEAKVRAQMLEEEGERVQQAASGDLHKLQRELQYTKQELEKFRELSKVAEAEARRLSAELNEAKISIVTLGGDASNFNANMDPAASGATAAAAPAAAGGKSGSSSAAPLAASKSMGNMNDPEARKMMEQRIAQVKEMLKEQHAAEMAEHLEPLQDELNRYKKLYEDLRSSVDEELQVQKDTLTQMYEEEIREIRDTSNDVQEKLKKNHMTIKKSYQRQKEELQDENEELTAQVARLTEQLQNGGVAPATSSAPASGGAAGKQPSLAEMMIAKKKAEKAADDAQQQLQDLKTEIDYVNTEKQALERQLREYEPKEGEERMKPAAVRKLRQDFDKIKEDKENLEKDLFKLKAAQALSGPQNIAGGDDKGMSGNDNAIDDFDSQGPSQAAILEQKEDMSGDFEGTKVFVDKMLKFPYFSGAQKVANSHQAIAGSLTTDLDEFRRILRLRFYFLGAPGCGKTAALKCLTAASTPLIRSCPDTIPTLHPLPATFFVEDIMTSKNDLHKRYVKFEEIADDDGQNKVGFMSGMMSGLASAVGLGGNNGVSDPSKIYIETLDFPGNQTFFRGFPPYLLPSKNVMYIIAYNLTQPVAVIAEDIALQLRNIHAAVHRDYNSQLGGDGPRVAVCLLGTHRDSMRDSRDSSVISFLNKITIAIGPEFHKLRGDKAYGLQVVGNFATSARDWTVISTKPNAPNNFRDLCAYLATFGQKLYENTPSSFLPTKKETAAFSSYMIGDDNITIQGEKTHNMDPLEQRMRKGVITFLTALHREQKVRWLMADREMRSLIAEHLEVDEKTAVGNNVVNFVMREIRVRNVVTVLPSHIYEPKYLPVTGHEQVLPRDGLIVLDPARLLAFYSVFIGGQWIPKIPPQVYKDIVTRALKEDKNAAPMFDINGLKQNAGPLAQGVLTQDAAQVLLNRFIPMVGSDARLLFEFLCVMGLGTGLRGENAMLAPSHFNSSMPPLLTGYMSFLVTNYGDGLGRKYQLTAAPDSFFARLQTILVPFGNAPVKDPDSLAMNFKDGCFLILEKSRLKWGTYGSKVLKDAIVNISVPVRGIIKLEGNNLYVACTGRSSNSQQAVTAVRTLMDGIHHHILGLCRREFRGVSATFQEMQLSGVESKREKLADGIKSYVESMGGGASTVQEQLAHVGNMNDPAGKEIDNALKALPTWMYVE